MKVSYVPLRVKFLRCILLGINMYLNLIWLTVWKTNDHQIPFKPKFAFCLHQDFGVTIVFFYIIIMTSVCCTPFFSMLLFTLYGHSCIVDCMPSMQPWCFFQLFSPQDINTSLTYPILPLGLTDSPSFLQWERSLVVSAFFDFTLCSWT